MNRISAGFAGTDAAPTAMAAPSLPRTASRRGSSSTRARRDDGLHGDRQHLLRHGGRLEHDDAEHDRAARAGVLNGGADVASSDGRRYSPNPMPSASSIVVDVGDVPVALTTSDAALLAMLEQRFHRFLNHPAPPVFEFDITVVPGESLDADADLEVSAEHGQWHLRRGDFQAEWNPDTRRGSIRQTLSPYAADCVLRIVHTLLLSREQGFLLHASSVVRDGRAFLFTGPSGAGKTTIVRHAPGRRDGPDRRNLLRATAGRRLRRLRDAVCRRVGGRRRADLRTDRRDLPARPRFRSRPHGARHAVRRANADAQHPVLRERPDTDASRARHGVRFRGERCRHSN